MKRTMIVMFALALLVGFSGSVMAFNDGTKLGAIAKQECKTGTTAWFGSGLNTEDGFIGLFPYFPGNDGDWWGGYSLSNTNAEFTFPENSLCFVAVNADGTGVATVYANPVYPKNMIVGLVDEIDTDAKWGNRLYMGVFARNQNGAVDNKGYLKAFGMIGDGVQGQGYFTPTSNPAKELTFEYTPGTPWWRGLAIVNVSNNTPTYIAFTVTQEDGVVKSTSAANRIMINGGNMKVDVLEELLSTIDPTKRAVVTVRSWKDTTATDWAVDGNRGEDIFGFAMFGDGQQAMGYTRP